MIGENDDTTTGSSWVNPNPDTFERRWPEGLTALWSSEYGRPLTNTDIDEIVYSVQGFFSTLHRWNTLEESKKKDAEPRKVPTFIRSIQNSALFPSNYCYIVV